VALDEREGLVAELLLAARLGDDLLAELVDEILQRVQPRAGLAFVGFLEAGERLAQGVVVELQLVLPEEGGPARFGELVSMANPPAKGDDETIRFGTRRAADGFERVFVRERRRSTLGQRFIAASTMMGTIER
jgi:hypothetical protein